MCQAIYNLPYAQEGKIVSARPSFSRSRGSHSAAAPEPHRRQGNLCLLLRGRTWNEPAENLPAPGLSSPRRNRRCSPSRQVDALSSSRAERSSCCRDLGGDTGALARAARHAKRFNKADRYVLRSRCSGTPSRSAPAFGLASHFQLEPAGPGFRLRGSCSVFPCMPCRIHGRFPAGGRPAPQSPNEKFVPES